VHIYIYIYIYSFIIFVLDDAYSFAILNRDGPIIFCDIQFFAFEAMRNYNQQIIFVKFFHKFFQLIHIYCYILDPPIRLNQGRNPYSFAKNNLDRKKLDLDLRSRIARLHNLASLGGALQIVIRRIRNELYRERRQ